MTFATARACHWRRWVACTLLVGTSACGLSDPEPTHWSRLLQDQLDTSTQHPCWRVAFPPQLDAQRAELRVPLRAMVRDGLLVEHDHFEQVELSREGRLWVPTPRFELTERGRREYRADVGGFCV